MTLPDAAPLQIRSLALYRPENLPDAIQTRPGKQEVSLNGNGTGEFFNQIQYLEFGADGKTVQYVGRIGRAVYFVTHELIP